MQHPSNRTYILVLEEPLIRRKLLEPQQALVPQR